MGDETLIPLREKLYWTVVAETPGIGPVTFFQLLAKFGSAESLWKADSEQLRLYGVNEMVRTMLVRRRKMVDPELHMQSLVRQGVDVVCKGEIEYPLRLAAIRSAPPVLFVRGTLTQSDNKAIAVVGTRKPTGYGREVTERLVTELVSLGFTIISGMARGIDGVAHRTAITSGGRTIGFLGGGIDSIYPAEHIGLANEIMRQGALMSEFPPGFQAVRGSFPARNRLISGMSLGVLVVEGLSKSGTKHTADHARAQGRPVFVVPGPITSPMSNGPMDMMADGAVMVRSGQDIVNYLSERQLLIDNMQANGVTKVKKQWKFADEVEELLYMILEMEPLDSNTLIKKSTLPAKEVLTAISMMELKGMVKLVDGEYRTI